MTLTMRYGSTPVIFTCMFPCGLIPYRVLAQSGLWEFDDDAPWCGIAGVGASRRGVDCVYGAGFSHQRRWRFLVSRQGARGGNRSSGVPMRWRLRNRKTSSLGCGCLLSIVAAMLW